MSLIPTTEETKQTERRNHIARLERELKEAQSDNLLTNRALDVLKQFKASNKEEIPPMLQDYYAPSDDMKNYNIAASVFLALFTGVGLYLSYDCLFS